jgi:hypothetical protein
MIHLFKTSDKSWIFTGTTIPSNMEDENYIQGVLPEGETWDHEYNYTCIDGVATKGDKIDISGLVQDNGYSEKRLNAYPNIAEQLDMQYHDAVNGTTIWKDTIAAVKNAHPKG